MSPNVTVVNATRSHSEYSCSWLRTGHFFHHNGCIFNVKEFEADHDEAAKAYAANVLRSSIGNGYEIWRAPGRRKGGPVAPAPSGTV
jgi:hypothetical protein